MSLRSCALLAAACIACILLTSRAASAQVVAQEPERVLESWHEGDPIPTGYSPSRRSRRGLVIGGSLLFGISGAINLIGAAGNFLLGGPTRENWLLAPGVGPLVLMAETTNPVGNVFLAVDALAQLGGIAMLTYGLASPTTVLVRDDGALSFAITPMLGSGRTGLGFVAQF